MASGTTAERRLGPAGQRLRAADVAWVVVVSLLGISLVASSAAATTGQVAAQGERLPNGEPVPDRASVEAGGIAARIHRADGEPVAGDVFLLMGAPGSLATARVYDDTPYVHSIPISQRVVSSRAEPRTGREHANPAGAFKPSRAERRRHEREARKRRPRNGLAERSRCRGGRRAAVARLSATSMGAQLGRVDSMTVAAAPYRPARLSRTLRTRSTS